MTPDLVIFDCDGVLVDTEPTTDRVMAANFARYGLHLPVSEVSAMFIGGTMRSAGEVARDMGAKLPDNWIDEINAEVGVELAKGVATYAGLFELLDALAARKIAIAIASNGPMSKMEITLKPSGLWDRFTGRIYSGHNHAPKPKPDMLLHACAVAGVTPDRAVMIDDSVAGCTSALNAKMRCFGFLPEGDTAPLQAVGAIPVRSMAEVGRHIGVLV